MSYSNADFLLKTMGGILWAYFTTEYVLKSTKFHCVNIPVLTMKSVRFQVFLAAMIALQTTLLLPSKTPEPQKEHSGGKNRA